MDNAMNKGVSEQLHIAAWNARGLSSKGSELVREVLQAHIGVAIISGMKKKLKGLKELHYLLQYSGVTREKSIFGIAILINKKRNTESTIILLWMMEYWIQQLKLREDI
jgi:hypothetical protein